MSDKVVLYSEFDGVEIETDCISIKKSITLTNMYKENLSNTKLIQIENNDDNSTIKLIVPDIPGYIIKLIIEWLEKTKNEEHTKHIDDLIYTYVSGNVIDSWEDDYLNKVYNNSIDDLFQFISAAELLQIPDLVSLASTKAANLFKDLSEEQINKLFSVEE